MLFLYGISLPDHSDEYARNTRFVTRLVESVTLYRHDHEYTVKGEESTTR